MGLSQSNPTAQFTALRTFLYCSIRGVGKAKQSPEHFLTWGNGAESPRKPTQIEFTRQSTEEERAANRENCRGL